MLTWYVKMSTSYVSIMTLKIENMNTLTIYVLCNIYDLPIFINLPVFLLCGGNWFHRCESSRMNFKQDPQVEIYRNTTTIVIIHLLFLIQIKPRIATERFFVLLFLIRLFNVHIGLRIVV